MQLLRNAPDIVLVEMQYGVMTIIGVPVLAEVD